MEENNDYGEEELADKIPSLYTDFPNYDESSLGTFTSWPTGQDVVGQFYQDLFGPASKNPLMPSIINKDPALQIIARARACLGHFAILQFSGSFASQGIASQTTYGTIFNFSNFYGSYSAILIQRFWRAKKSHSKHDLAKFLLVKFTNPAMGKVEEETEIRKKLIRDILAACPFKYEVTQ